MDQALQFLLGDEFGQPALGALVASALGVIVFTIFVYRRARHGIKYLEWLRTDACDKISALLRTNGVASSDLDTLLLKGGYASYSELRLAIIELRNGLARYSDEISESANGLVSHQRLADVFSAQLPERFIAQPSAAATSRLFVQIGLTLSVFFIILSLFAMDPNEPTAVVGPVASKFLFTFVGLSGSLILQGLTACAAGKARQAFASFENQLEASLRIRVVSPNSALFQLLTELRQQVAALSDNATKLSESATKLTGAADKTHVLLAYSRKVGKDIALHFSKEVGDSATGFVDKVSGAGNKFKEEISSAGSAFGDSNIIPAGNSFKDQIQEASSELRGSAQGAGYMLVTEFATATKSLEPPLTKAVESFQTTSRSAGEAFAQAVGKLETTVKSVTYVLKQTQAALEKAGDRLESAAGQVDGSTGDEKSPNSPNDGPPHGTPKPPESTQIEHE